VKSQSVSHVMNGCYIISLSFYALLHNAHASLCMFLHHRTCVLIQALMISATV